MIDEMEHKLTTRHLRLDDYAAIEDISTRVYKGVATSWTKEEVGRLMAIMTENRIRHIPIIDAGKLAGIVSIGDVVKAQLTVHEVRINYLKDYIEGKYPA